MTKFLKAAGFALAMGLAGMGTIQSAEAKVNLDINIGIPGPVYIEPRPIYPGWGYPVYYANRWVNCGQGAQIVRSSGFRSVRAINCRGAHYDYVGRASGRTFTIKLRAVNGRIVGVRRL